MDGRGDGRGIAEQPGPTGRDDRQKELRQPGEQRHVDHPPEGVDAHPGGVEIPVAEEHGMDGEADNRSGKKVAGNGLERGPCDLSPTPWDHRRGHGHGPREERGCKAAGADTGTDPVGEPQHRPHPGDDRRCRRQDPQRPRHGAVGEEGGKRPQPHDDEEIDPKEPRRHESRRSEDEAERHPEAEAAEKVDQHRHGAGLPIRRSGDRRSATAPRPGWRRWSEKAPSSPT